MLKNKKKGEVYIPYSTHEVEIQVILSEVILKVLPKPLNYFWK